MVKFLVRLNVRVRIRDRVNIVTCNSRLAVTYFPKGDMIGFT